jgi:holliday junction DNA helicase RuvA
MIASIQGVIAQRRSDAVVIVVGGVGVEVFTTSSAQEKCRENDTAFLHTRLIVREDALILFGFVSEYERDMFDTLLKVSGVGPKLAVQILSFLSTDNLRSAVASERPEMLTRVPGIGKKTAQKILIELKDKLPVGLDAVPMDDFDNVNAEVMDALVSLGFSIIEAQRAIQSLPLSAPRDVEERVKLTLQFLSR